MTTVDTGGDAPLNIVCGAPNVAAGQKVIVATVGAVCHPTEGDPFKIKKGKIRGEVSEGMICAEDELGLGKGHDGILVLDASAKVGAGAAGALGVESDHRLEIGLTPNRTDAMGHIGVARDLRAALLWNGGTGTGEGVPALTAAAPHALAEGKGPISLHVEHAFDADRIAGQQVRVRKATEGEAFTALDGKEMTLTAADLVIADAEKPMCLAGVFGGAHSGVQEGTTSVFLESAWFEPVTIRKSAKRHTLSTDASFRFERGVDPEMTASGMEKAVSLLAECAGATPDGGLQVFCGELPQGAQVELSWNTLDTMIGVSLDPQRVKGILASLDIGILSEENGALQLSVPAYRRDVTRPADVVEEILRIHGYDHIPLPGRMTVSLSPKPHPDPEQLRNDLARTLVGRGFHEVMHNSLVPSEHLKLAEDLSLNPDRAVILLNPLSSELDAMRQSLLFQGLETVARNKNHQRPDLSIFEFGKVYAEDGQGGHVESERLALTVSGQTAPESWRKLDQDGMSWLKGAVEALLTQCGVAGLQCAPLPGGDLFNFRMQRKR